ncbi:MAG: sulfatase [Thermoleophilaceae bacterium]
MSESRTTRRRFLEASAAAAALAATGSSDRALAAADGPNVVVIVIDTLRTDHVYGSRARTPNMDELLRSGLRFTRAYPEAMPTVPVRNALLSGRRQFPFRGWHDHRGLLNQPGWEPIDNVRSAFTTALHRAGYWTAYATDNPFLGYAGPYERLRESFDAFARRGGQLGVVRHPSTVSNAELRSWLHPGRADRDATARVRRYLANGRYSHDESKSWAAQVFSDGARLLEIGARKRPFALVVDTFQPHEPWTPPDKYLKLYADPREFAREPALPRYGRTDYLKGRNRRRVVDRIRALYAAELTMTDRWLGTFLDRLHELNLEDDTVIALVGDHGFYLGERGWTGKISTELHPELTRVPMVLVDPRGRRAGGSTSYFASPHDIGPTLLSMAGVRVPAAMDGVDLSPLLAGGSPPPRPYAYGGYKNSFYIRTDRWALSGLNRGSDFQLYDLRKDRGERNNLASSHPRKVRQLYGVVRKQAGGRLPHYDT